MKLPPFEIKGDTPYELGFNYGSTLRVRIRSTITIYHSWFINIGGTDELLKSQCDEYRALMMTECPLICEEIEGISKGSGVELWKIYLVNCRTEIFNLLLDQNKKNKVSPMECSGIMDVNHCITAQNWDWIEEMHDNAVLLRIRKPGRSILMLIEPGMVGKIGLNDHGIGCTLMLLGRPKFYGNDFIHSKDQRKGLPIHVILRLFLECNTLNEIDELLGNITVNTYSCIGVADGHRNGYFMEFCGFGKYEKLYASKRRMVFHTNHYLGCGLRYIGEDEAAHCSLPRYKQLNQLYNHQKSEMEEGNNVNGNKTIENIKAFLSNDKNEEFPICRRFKMRKSFARKVGTITSIIMDLKEGSMTLTQGSPIKYPFKKFMVNENEKSLIFSKL